MDRKRWILRGLLALLLLALGSCVSQREARVTSFRTAPLFGMVYDHDQRAVPGALVLVDGEEGPRSDINGRFVLRSLARGEHVIEVRKDGYEGMRAPIEFLSRTQALYLKVISLEQLLRKAEDELEARRFDEARELLERASAVNPVDPVLLYLSSLNYRERGEPGAAVEPLQQVLQLGYRQPVVYLTLADIYQFELEDPAAAALYLERYLRVRRDPEIEGRLQSLRKEQSDVGVE